MSEAMKLFEAMTKNRPPPKTGLQRKVQRLYRDLLRTAREKPQMTGKQKEDAMTAIREQFRANARASKGNVEAIEFYLEQGERQLAMLRRPQVGAVSSFIVPKK